MTQPHWRKVQKLQLVSLFNRWSMALCKACLIPIPRPGGAVSCLLVSGLWNPPFHPSVMGKTFFYVSKERTCKNLSPLHPPCAVWLPCPGNVNVRKECSPRGQVRYLLRRRKEEDFFRVLNNLLFFFLGTSIINVTWWEAEDSWCVLEYGCGVFVDQSTMNWFKCWEWNNRERGGGKTVIFSNCSQEWNWFTPNRAWNNIGRWHCCYGA